MAKGNLNNTSYTKITDFTDELNRLYALGNGSTEDSYIILKELIDYIISQGGAGGDMTKAVYDSENDGVVNDSRLINGDTVANDSAVQSNTAKPGYNTAASGLPSTNGAGDIDMSRVNDYYSETAITGDVTWGLTNIVIDKAISIDVKADSNVINLVQAGVTFKGAIIAGVVQGLDASESNLIAIWAQTATIMWVTVILNEV